MLRKGLKDGRADSGTLMSFPAPGDGETTTVLLHSLERGARNCHVHAGSASLSFSSPGTTKGPPTSAFT
jgi:hypothetical protein